MSPRLWFKKETFLINITSKLQNVDTENISTTFVFKYLPLQHLSHPLIGQVKHDYVCYGFVQVLTFVA